MKAATLEALNGSIEKWKAIVAGKESDRGGENCPLCQIFAQNGNECRGCPVKAKTRRIGCLGSPWEEWCDVQKLSYPWLADNKERLALAKKELKFLRSLLPKKAPA